MDPFRRFVHSRRATRASAALNAALLEIERYIYPVVFEIYFMLFRPFSVLHRSLSTLPRLPVPSLDRTLEKYLKTVRPHVTGEEFSKTVDAVNSFLSKQGPILQQRLEARAGKMDNWFYDWWNEAAYFGYRESLPVNVSYFFVYNDELRLRNKPTQRAAEIITAAFEFRDKVTKGEIVETSKGQPLCMDSYKWMFNACRYPRRPVDYAKTFDFSKNHVAVVRNNNFYVFDVARNGKRLSISEIVQQLEWIRKDSTKNPPVGILTSMNRDEWADARDKLVKLGNNAKLLEQLESSAFLLCLDSTSPVTRDQASWNCWVGKNRFYDKSLQFIVFENGKAGFNGEVFFVLIGSIVAWTECLI